MANPLACAVALASLDLLERGDWASQVAGIERILREELAGAAGLAGVRDVRVLGAIAVIETEQAVPMEAATAAALELDDVERIGGASVRKVVRLAWDDRLDALQHYLTAP